MGVLDENIKILLAQMELTQWKTPTIKSSFLECEIMTRENLRKIEKHTNAYFTTRTSGSTGEPVTISKTLQDYIWFVAANIRDIRWRKWDVTKTIAHIKISATEGTVNGWGIPTNIEPIQGVSYINGYKPISELQEWLEKVNPHYINCFPSIFKLIDTSKISNFIDWKGTGEVGGTIYSSEECGVIALQCPDNPKVMHVMENQYVERDVDGSLIITTFTNNHIRRYKHGDHIELGKCSCSRGLQTITEVKGRVRNMFTLPNGDKKWPLIGSLNFYEDFGIKRYKATQKSINELELQIISEPLKEREEDLKNLVKEWINSPINVTITYTNDFPNYKFEEFVSLL
jgi:phenylacetate-CoA ligase